MPIPNLPQFENILSSIRRDDPKSEDYISVKAIDVINGLDENGNRSSLPPTFIYLEINDTLTFDGLIKKIKGELMTLNHPSSDRVALSILLLFTYHPNKERDAVDSFNEILGLITKATASPYHILKKFEEIEPIGFEFGDFKFGILDHSNFKYKCKLSSSDYYDRYMPMLKGFPAITRKPYCVQIINWYMFFFETHKFLNYPLLYVLNYFEAISSLLFLDFWTQFNEQQEMQIAYGIEPIDDKHYKDTLMSREVIIFNDILFGQKRAGYVVPGIYAQFDIIISHDYNDRIKHFNNIRGIDYLADPKNEIEVTMKSFVKFVAKGSRLLNNGSNNEGFLHYVIALDLLFGDKGDNTKSVCNRGAVLIYRRTNKTYTDQKNVFEKIYDARSKYVHSGTSIDVKLLEEVKIVCKFILLSLLKVRSNPDYTAQGFTIWKKQLDYACASLDAQLNIDESLCEKIGM